MRALAYVLEKSKGKLTYASVAALVVGLAATLAGVDLAPEELDAVIAAMATAGAVYGRWRATREAS